MTLVQGSTTTLCNIHHFGHKTTGKGQNILLELPTFLCRGQKRAHSRCTWSHWSQQGVCTCTEQSHLTAPVMHSSELMYRCGRMHWRKYFPQEGSNKQCTKREEMADYLPSCIYNHARVVMLLRPRHMTSTTLPTQPNLPSLPSYSHLILDHRQPNLKANWHVWLKWSAQPQQDGNTRY